MMYLVEFSVDFYVAGYGLAIPSWIHVYSEPFDNVADAITFQRTVQEHYKRHDLYGVLKCDEEGVSTEYLQYGSFSKIVSCDKNNVGRYIDYMTEVNDAF